MEKRPECVELPAAGGLGAPLEGCTIEQMKAVNLRVVLRVTALVALAAVGACRSETGAVRKESAKYAGNNVSEHVRTPLTGLVNRAAKQGRLPWREAQPGMVASVDSGRDRPFVQAGVFSVPNLSSGGDAKTRLIAFKSSAFPYRGAVPGTHAPFLNIADGERRGHRTASNRIYWEDETYSDPRVLLHIPRGFDIRKPAVMVLYFHGHGATLERDVEVRQQVPAQISDSGMNAVLVAPQLAVNARDSSPGKLWEPGALRRFLDEAAEKLARLQGDPAAAAKFTKMPIVIVAYSGGYVATAWSITNGGLGKRLRGVVLLDALYGEFGKFADWIKEHRSAFFISAYANSTRAKNAEFERALAEQDIPVKTHLEQNIGQGSVTFISTGTDTLHRDFVTHAWTEHPIKDLLQRLNLPARLAKTAAVP